MNTTQTATAAPAAGTIYRVAECRRCQDQIIDYGRGWAHADSGSVECW